MLIKLPIIKDNIINKKNFKLQRLDNKIVLRTIDDEFCNYEIFISNLDFCLTKISLDFPFEMDIIEDKYLFSKFYFTIAFLDKFNCELDFFSILLKNINKLGNDYKYIDLDFIYKNFHLLIKKSLVYIERRENFASIYDLKSYYDNVLNNTINILNSMIYKLSLKLNNLGDKTDDKIPSKIKEILSFFYEIKISFNGSDNKEIKEHIKNIMNYNSDNSLEISHDKLIDGKNYFIEIPNDRVIKYEFSIKDTKNLQIGQYLKIEKSKCKFFEYNPSIFESFSISNLVKNIINNDYFIKNSLCKRLFNNNFEINEKFGESTSKLFKYLFYDKNNKILLSSIDILNYNLVEDVLPCYNISEIEFELDILEKGYEDKKFISYLSEKYKNDTDSKMKILNILFKNYNFPLTFNKKRLNTNFELIMYFSFLNIDILIKVVDSEKIYLNNLVITCLPSKLKNLFYNLIKFYYQYQNGSLENITYNFKFYQDYIYVYIIKNIIQKTTILSELFRKNDILFNNLIKVYKTNFILNQMISNLTWNNLSEKLPYLDYFYKSSEYIFYQGKINKNLFDDSIDFKIKSIIIDKFSMFKYLKNEKDFIKWIKFIKIYIDDLYEKNISVNLEDLTNLGKLIFKLINLEVQDLKDDKYIELITFCQKNKKLILLSSRINLKIKDKLPILNCNLNLGFFAKHLNYNNHDKIEINNQHNEIDTLKNEVTVLQKKYVKYKHKYMRSKSENSSSNSATVTNTTTANIINNLDNTTHDI